MTRTHRFLWLLLALGSTPVLVAQSGNQPPALLSDLVDISRDFQDYTNGYFLADRLAAFDPATAAGKLVWQRHQLSPRIAFSNMEAVLRPFEGVVFPDREYATNPACPSRSSSSRRGRCGCVCAPARACGQTSRR